MSSYIFITKSEYDPVSGRHIKDPYIDELSTMGACRPDLRKYVSIGDCIVLVSGKTKGVDQFIVGAFQVEEKITSKEAYDRFKHLRLHRREDGQLDGNIITTAEGEQHPLDEHTKFEKRLDNYLVGRTLVRFDKPEEVERGRAKCMSILAEVFGKTGEKPRDVIGRMSKIDDSQLPVLLDLLRSLKTTDREKVRAAVANRFAVSQIDIKPQPNP